ncbi:MAG: hypothetical protein AAGM04_02450 [Pseudomonadota bacterium]
MSISFPVFTAVVLKPLSALLLAIAMLFALPALIGTHQAEAGLLKKVKTGSKFVGKGFRKMERAGRKLSRKKGIVGKFGKSMRKVGRGGRKATRGLRKGVSRGQRAMNRQLSKSKAGRGMLKAGRAYKKFRKNKVNRAFKRCRAEWCEDVRDGADALIPG